MLGAYKLKTNFEIIAAGDYSTDKQKIKLRKKNFSSFHERSFYRGHPTCNFRGKSLDD